MITIPEDNTDGEDKSYLDDYSDSSKQMIKEVLFDAYEAQWQRTHDIEHKASSIIGFVGIIFTITIATISTVLVYADDDTRNKIFFSSILPSIWILIILLLMGACILFGILAIRVKFWDCIIAKDFLEYCKKETDCNTKKDNKLLEAIFDDYEGNITKNSEINEKVAKYLIVSHASFVLSLVFLIIFILHIIYSFK